MIGVSIKVIATLVGLAVADIIVVWTYIALRQPSEDNDIPYDVLSPLPPSNSTFGIYGQAAVVSYGEPCAGFGRQMLAKGGSVIDAVITTVLCEGVCVMYANGIGGGFLMTLYNKTENRAYSLVARETAPAAATQDMYKNNWSLSTLGPLAAGIPGELKGYQEAHEKYGKLPWKELFEPTIRLCEEGVPVNQRMADRFALTEESLRTQPSFIASILNTTGGHVPKVGDFLKLPTLAKTFRIIADSPIKAEELYNGSLTESFVADIQAAGGIITTEDMNNYKVRWEEPETARISESMTVYSAALPGSGILVNFILQLLDGLVQFAYSDIQRSQLIIEAFKHAFGLRPQLGDPYFMNNTFYDQIRWKLTNSKSILQIRDKIRVGWTTENITYYGADNTVPDDHGTNNVVVWGPDGSAVCVTSSLNLNFGSRFVSTSTGILMNNVMDDFSTPGQTNAFGVKPSPVNFIVPGKRPLSSMSPTIVVDRNGDVRLVLGAAGGTTITTQVVAVSIKNLWQGKNVKEAIDEPRYHHQLLPMNVTYEYGILQEVVDSWKAIGHSTTRIVRTNFVAVVSAIARLGANLTANSDWRRPGWVDGF